MSDRPARELTLRELFTAVDRQAREVVAHIELNFQPKLKSLRKLVRPRKDDDSRRVSDIAIRNQAAQLLESESYTAKLYTKLEEYTEAIDEQVRRIVDSDSLG